MSSTWGQASNSLVPDSGNTSYTRDALGRLATIILADGKTQTFVYDVAGNLAQITNPSSYTTAYTYHPGGQIASIRYPSGLKVFYRLGTGSNVGRIVQVDVQQPGATSPVQVFVNNLAYTALNQPKSWNWSSTDSASRSFDASGRMVSNEFATYSYDAASRITGISQTLWATEGTNPFTTAISWTAAYDNRDRLTSFTRAGAATQYSYDANSNRLSSSDTVTSSTDLGADFDQPDRQKTTAQTHTMAATSNRLLGFSQTQTTQQASTNTVLGTSSTQVSYQLDAAGRRCDYAFEHN